MNLHATKPRKVLIIKSGIEPLQEAAPTVEDVRETALSPYGLEAVKLGRD